MQRAEIVAKTSQLIRQVRQKNPRLISQQDDYSGEGTCLPPLCQVRFPRTSGSVGWAPGDMREVVSSTPAGPIFRVLK